MNCTAIYKRPRTQKTWSRFCSFQVCNRDHLPRPYCTLSHTPVSQLHILFLNCDTDFDYSSPRCHRRQRDWHFHRYRQALRCCTGSTILSFRGDSCVPATIYFPNFNRLVITCTLSRKFTTIHRIPYTLQFSSDNLSALPWVWGENRPFWGNTWGTLSLLHKDDPRTVHIPRWDQWQSRRLHLMLR